MSQSSSRSLGLPPRIALLGENNGNGSHHSTRHSAKGFLCYLRVLTTTLGGTIITLILQLRKLRHQEVRQSVQEYTRAELGFQLRHAAVSHYATCPGCQSSNLVLLSDAPLLLGRALIPYSRSGDVLELTKWCHLVCVKVCFVLRGSFVFEGTAFEGWHSSSREDRQLPRLQNGLWSDRPGCISELGHLLDSGCKQVSLVSWCVKWDIHA